MQVHILDQVYQYDNRKEEVPQLIEKIETEINTAELIFSHLVVDGEEVYENHGDYLESHIDDIQQIEVEARSVNQLITDILESMDQYLSRCKAFVEPLANQFYQAADEERWQSFADLLEGMQWLLQSVDTLTQQFAEKLQDHRTPLATSNEQIKSVMHTMQTAVEQSDETMIADILLYELLEELEKLHMQTKSMILQRGDIL